MILEELALSEDEPDERVHTLVARGAVPGSPARAARCSARPTRSRRWPATTSPGSSPRTTGPANLVVVAAGASTTTTWSAAVGAASRTSSGRSVPAPARRAPVAEPPSDRRRCASRPSRRTWSSPGRPSTSHDPDRYPLAVLNQVLGGGLSSRLFQEIREHRGLAYSVYSYSALYDDAGLLLAYAGTGPRRVAEVLQADRWPRSTRCVADGITERRAERWPCGYLEGSLLLGLEDSGSRMARLGSQVTAHGAVTPVDDHVARIRAVTVADVQRVADRVAQSGAGRLRRRPAHRRRSRLSPRPSRSCRGGGRRRRRRRGWRASG